MEKFDIIKESQLAEIKFERLSQIKTYAVFDLDEFFIYNEGILHSLTGNGKIDVSELKRDIIIGNLLDQVQDDGTHFVAEFESMDDTLDFYNRWKR
jgi:hypothetical protein